MYVKIFKAINTAQNFLRSIMSLKALHRAFSICEILKDGHIKVNMRIDRGS